MRFSPKIAGGLGRNLELQSPVIDEVKAPRRRGGRERKVDGSKPGRVTQTKKNAGSRPATSKKSAGSRKTKKTAGSQPPTFDPEVDNPLFYNRSNLLTVSVSNGIRAREGLSGLPDVACAVFAVGTPEARSAENGSLLYPTSAGKPVSFAVRIGPVVFIPLNRTANVSFAPLSARELFSNTYYLYWSPLPGTEQVSKEYIRPQYPELAGCWTAMGGEAGRPPVGCNRVPLSSAGFLFGRVPKVEITDYETNPQNGNCLVGIEQGLSFDALGPPEERPRPKGQCIPKYRKTPTPAVKAPLPFVVRRPAPALPVGVAPFVKPKPIPPGYVTCMPYHGYKPSMLDSPCRCLNAKLGTGIWGHKPGENPNELGSCFIPPPAKKKSNWVGNYDKATNRGYWVNPANVNESTWIRPDGASVWIEQYDPVKKQPWWWNSDTEEHTYIKPADA